MSNDEKREITERKPLVLNTTARSMDYRLPADKGGGRHQRCSRCHASRRLDSPVIYNMAARTTRPGQPDMASSGLAPIMVGNELLGFICSDCFRSLCRHVLQVFPDETGFPHVDQSGFLVPTPRCDSCNAILHYARDGRHMLCPECNTDGANVVDGSSP